jgi:hypothetical protein
MKTFMRADYQEAHTVSATYQLIDKFTEHHVSL